MCEASQQELQALAEKHAEKLKEFSALQNELQVNIDDFLVLFSVCC